MSHHPDGHNCPVCGWPDNAHKACAHHEAPLRAVVGVVELRDNFLDGGYFVRCRGCSLPARVTDDTGNCPHCGWSYVGAQRCTRAEYRASRADDVELPPRPPSGDVIEGDGHGYDANTGVMHGRAT